MQGASVNQAHSLQLIYTEHTVDSGYTSIQEAVKPAVGMTCCIILILTLTLLFFHSMHFSHIISGHQ